MTGRAVYFDLEGPLSPQDNAFEVLSLAKNGRKIFEVLSSYDDMLTLQKREGYEPGDTLKLIVPFLLYYGITEKDVEKVSRRARIIEGADEVVEGLREEGWLVRVISTSYQQHAYSIGRKLGVEPKNIACTDLPLTEYEALLGEEEVFLMEEMERRILMDFSSAKEEEMVHALDKFYFNDLPRTSLGRVLEEVQVIGGNRKVRALLEFSRRDGNNVEDSVAVGDSITDFKMLREVSKRGGLALAFNGNEYCIPYADVAVAATNLGEILPFIDAFKRGGKEAVRKTAEEVGKKRAGTAWLKKADVREVIRIHEEYRKRVRGEAGKLG
jgi:energy-converting hydrogenase A subunit R